MILVDIYSVDRTAALQALYFMLAARDPEVNISHREMPTFEEHTTFFDSCPYEAWYFIDSQELKFPEFSWIGNCYLTRSDEIGVFLCSDYRGHGLGTKVVKMLMAKHKRKRYLANVAPTNAPSVKLFTSLGFKLIQYTHELRT